MRKSLTAFRGFLPLMALLFFFGLPLLVLALTAFIGKPIPILDRLLSGSDLMGEISSKFSWNAFEELLSVRRYQKATVNSLWLACVTASLASILALPVSLAFASGRLYGRRLLEFLLLLPLVTPAFLYAFALILLFGKGGFFDGLLNPFSVEGLIITQVTAFLPLAVLAQTVSFSLYESGWTAAARALGARPSFSAIHVWLPLNLPAILTGWVLVALRSLGDFVGPMLLTSTRFRLLVLETWRDLAGSNWWPTATALSLELLAIAAIFLIAEAFLLRRNRSYSQLLKAPSWMLAPASPVSKAVSTFVTFCILALPLLAVAVILEQSLGGIPSQWSLEHFRAALKEAPPLIQNSLILGVCASGACLLMALMVTRLPASWKPFKNLFMALATFAYAIPATVYAIGLVAAFNGPPVALHFTPALLIIAVVVTRLNYALRMVGDAQEKTGPEMDQAASTMGASALFRFRWVSLPYLKGALVASGVLIFISALQDVSIAILISPPSFYPMSLEIARNIADGLFHQASALGVLLMTLLTLLSLVGLRGLSIEGIKEVQ